MKAEEILVKHLFGEQMIAFESALQAMEEYAKDQILVDRKRIKDHAKILVDSQGVKMHIESYYTKGEGEFIEVSHESIDVTPLIIE